MKKQINTIYLILTIATFFLLGAFGSTFAQTSDEWIIRVQDLIQKGEYDKVVIDASAIIKTQPNNAESYTYRARAYLLQKNYDMAFADADKVLSLDSRNTAALNVRGIVNINREKPEAALADFTSAIKIDPAFAKPYANRALVYFEKSDFDHALSDYDKAIELVNPPPAVIYFGRGNVYFALKKYDEAISDYTKAISIDPVNKAYYYNRGVAYRSQHDDEKAIADFAKTLKLDSTFSDAKDRLKEIIADNKAEIVRQKAILEKENANQENSVNSANVNNSGGATTDTNSGTVTRSSLPAGTYACFTTINIYAGRGGSGAYTYPIYNSTRQTRGSIRIQSGGTYLLDDGTTLHYTLSGNAIRWLDGTFAEASSSNIQTNNQGSPQILIKFNGDKDVWDCTKQ